jgi:hypothetical protein
VNCIYFATGEQVLMVLRCFKRSKNEKWSNLGQPDIKKNHSCSSKRISTKHRTHRDTPAVDLSHSSHNNAMQQGRKDQHRNAMYMYVTE